MPLNVSQARVILNADDLGYEPAVTRGIVEAMTEGIVSSTTLMVNTPYTAEAVTLAKAHALAVGLHFNLARFTPLSTVSAQWLTTDGQLDESKAQHWPVEEVAAELRAQIQFFQQALLRPPTHLDVHKHLHVHANVLEAVIRVARERDFPVRSIDPVMRQLFQQSKVKTNDTFVGNPGHEADWTLARLEQRLAALPPSGVVELMCHPGYALTHFRSGYSAQREVELATFVAPEARALLKKYGVELLSWQEAFDESGI